MKLEILNNTFIKTKPLEFSLLEEHERTMAVTGNFYDVELLGVQRSHFKVRPVELFRFPYSLAYIFQGHARIIPDDPGAGLPKEVRLGVGFKSQLDNEHNPSGACNVTSIAMVLAYLLDEANGNRQLEDELYEQCLNSGLDRHSPYDLARLIEQRGFKDEFKPNSSIDEVREWIALEECPVVIHGYFTNYGHIITVVGYNDQGFFVHDPFGEWFPSGYQTHKSGANLHYSYRLIRRLCMPDGDLWAHFISKSESQ